MQYAAHTPGVGVADNTSARLDLDNEPQPVVLLLIDPACGGQSHHSAEDFIEGASEREHDGLEGQRLKRRRQLPGEAR